MLYATAGVVLTMMLVAVTGRSLAVHLVRWATAIGAAVVGLVVASAVTGGEHGWIILAGTVLGLFAGLRATAGPVRRSARHRSSSGASAALVRDPLPDERQRDRANLVALRTAGQARTWLGFAVDEAQRDRRRTDEAWRILRESVAHPTVVTDAEEYCRRFQRLVGGAIADPQSVDLDYAIRRNFPATVEYWLIAAEEAAPLARDRELATLLTSVRALGRSARLLGDALNEARAGELAIERENLDRRVRRGAPGR